MQNQLRRSDREQEGEKERGIIEDMERSQKHPLLNNVLHSSELYYNMGDYINLFK